MAAEEKVVKEAIQMATTSQPSQTSAPQPSLHDTLVEVGYSVVVEPLLKAMAYLGVISSPSAVPPAKTLGMSFDEILESFRKIKQPRKLQDDEILDPSFDSAFVVDTASNDICMLATTLFTIATLELEEPYRQNYWFYQEFHELVCAKRNAKKEVANLENPGNKQGDEKEDKEAQQDFTKWWNALEEQVNKIAKRLSQSWEVSRDTPVPKKSKLNAEIIKSPQAFSIMKHLITLPKSTAISEEKASEYFQGFYKLLSPLVKKFPGIELYFREKHNDLILIGKTEMVNAFIKSIEPALSTEVAMLDGKLVLPQYAKVIASSSTSSSTVPAAAFDASQTPPADVTISISSPPGNGLGSCYSIGNRPV